ncbi:MAG: ATP-dependent helicase HrpB [Pseudomonadales bacterium]|nr:ATP-dependent helicase HrpB [Pseudomonadales bacterium]
MNLPDLPINDVLGDIKSTLDGELSLIIEAPPGAGKTTQVPLALMDEDWLGYNRIIMLEPRRLAAKTAAHRMASIIGESPGQTIGYRMRHETRVSDYTKVEVVTEGVFSRMLQSDPSLEGIGLVIFDEFHERNLDSDIALSVCLKMREIFRNEDPLRLIAMSATLDSQKLNSVMQAPVIRSDGRMHPVDIIYGRASQPRDRTVDRIVETTLQAIKDNPDSSLLVFLPGQGEIRQTFDRLSEKLSSSSNIHPLYGNLSLAEQQAAIEPAVNGRKIVLATNIAETSLTIEGINVVIDSGLAREPSFDPGTGMSRLQTVKISAGSSTQRAGRAGRLEPGRCYRLWSSQQQDQLAPHTTPEVHKADLAGMALQLFQWGFQSPDELTFIDAPKAGNWEQAVSLLNALGALRQDLVSLSEHGEAMASVPAHPRLAHLLIKGAEAGNIGKAALLAALLSDRNPLAQENPDITTHLEILSGERSCPHQHRGWLQRTRNQARQFADNVKPIARTSILPEDEIAGYLLACAYPDRIARRRHKGGYQLANGRSVSFAEKQSLDKHTWLAIAEVSGMARSRGDVIRTAAPLKAKLFEGILSSQVTHKTLLNWDKKADRFIAEKRQQVGQLILSKTPLENVAPEERIAAIINYIREAGPSLLPFSREVKHWQTRVSLARTLDDSLPEQSEEALMQSLDDWLAPYLSDVARLSDLGKIDLVSILKNHLSWEQQQQIDKLTPTEINVPSGNKVKIDYSQSPPVLATKLQTMFGCTTTPTIMNGKLPLMIHLLSPAGRPLQVTQSLESFWRDLYPEVRKEMKGRYPKHPWPEDPLGATPTIRTGK